MNGKVGKQKSFGTLLLGCDSIHPEYPPHYGM